MDLYRPVGQAEHDLIRDSGWTAFPPRFDWQPIFYPVLNEEYATRIARDWNTKDPVSGFKGYVTKFTVLDSFIRRFQIQTVGSSLHQELWIPAEKLELFNANIIGKIVVIAEFP